VQKITIGNPSKTNKSKTMKKTLTLLSIVLCFNSFAQDTTYFDTHLNQSISKSTASQFSIDSISTDTLSIMDTAMANVFAPFPQFRMNVPSTYSRFILEYELVSIQGGYNYNVDTNNILLHNAAISTLGQNNYYDTIIISGGSTVDFEISNVSNNGRYQVTATIMHTTDTVFINSNSTSINEVESPKISVYPNPTRDCINIEGYLGKEFEILDLRGRILKSGIITNKLDLRNLLKGTYVLRVENSVLKVIKD
jgi:hypothetical protein